MPAGAPVAMGPKATGVKGANLATPTLPRGGTDLALYRVIRYGLPDTEMPSHNMTQREIWQMSAFVRTLGQAGEGTIRGDARKGEASGPRQRRVSRLSCCQRRRRTRRLHR